MSVWLITGSGGGLGRSIAQAALTAGHQVVATARDPKQLDDLKARWSENVLTLPLDVTDEAQGQAAVIAAVERFGRLDVLVNNAGYGDLRPFEQVSSAEFRQLVDTSLFGVVYMTRAALPVMRRQRRGHILQISSLGGRTAWPGNAAYHAAKWAVGGFTESVAGEVSPFGVVVTALEPGAMRTRWGASAQARQVPVLPDYETSVGATLRQLAGYWGNEPGDPEKVAQLILRLTEADHLPPHILLGSDALRIAREADAARAADADRWSAVSASIDIDADQPLHPLPTA